MIKDGSVFTTQITQPTTKVQNLEAIRREKVGTKYNKEINQRSGFTKINEDSKSGPGKELKGEVI